MKIKRIRRFTDDVERLAQLTPVESTMFLSSYLESNMTFPLYGVYEKKELRGVMTSGNLVFSVGFNNGEGIEECAKKIRRDLMWQQSFVGPRFIISSLWNYLESYVNYPFDVRNQLLLTWQAQSNMSDDLPSVSFDVPFIELRLAHHSDFLAVFPVARAMFIEEVGYDPCDSTGAYEQRLHYYLRNKRTYIGVIRENADERIIFKADIGALTSDVLQFQGVWVAPEYRGQGIGKYCMARVLRDAYQRHQVMMSLYVNEYNKRARRLYASLGFRHHCDWQTITLR
ncbi:MAG: GNAT family N-acetyltransferase [Actinomycetaceae bacterium]|nr:GNAT family N-acetyltransferase [Actinomycetaceae bacterium]